MYIRNMVLEFYNPGCRNLLWPSDAGLSIHTHRQAGCQGKVHTHCPGPTKNDRWEKHGALNASYVGHVCVQVTSTGGCSP